MTDFDKPLVAGNVKKAMAGKSSSDLWNVAPDDLRTLDGFNVRIRNQAYTDRVRWIADRIKANGFAKDKALAAFVAMEGGRERIYVTDGHRRLEAVKLAISEGCEIPHIPVVVKPRGTSLEDLTVDLKVANESEPLTLYENAIVCKRLATFGWPSAEIARRLGYASPQYVDGLLLLAGAPLAIRQMVAADAISATAAIVALQKHGDKAVDVLATGAAKAAGGRVTAKHLPGAEFKKALRKHAEPLWTAVGKLRTDPAFGMLSEELRAELIDLLEKVKK